MAPITGMFFKCIYCESEFFEECKPVEKWYINKYAGGEYYFTCIKCGAFLVPKSLVEGLSPIEYGRLYHKLFFMFSACENAEFCEDYGNYRPYCEEKHFTPRCLNSMFEMIDAHQCRFDRIEKLLRGEKLPEPPFDQGSDMGEADSKKN